MKIFFKLKKLWSQRGSFLKNEKFEMCLPCAHDGHLLIQLHHLDGHLFSWVSTMNFGTQARVSSLNYREIHAKYPAGETNLWKDKKQVFQWMHNRKTACVCSSDWEKEFKESVGKPLTVRTSSWGSATGAYDWGTEALPRRRWHLKWLRWEQHLQPGALRPPRTHLLEALVDTCEQHRFHS